VTRKHFEQRMKVLGCCLLGICCPPGGPEQRAAFRTFCNGAYGMPEAEADALFDAAVAQRH